MHSMVRVWGNEEDPVKETEQSERWEKSRPTSYAGCPMKKELQEEPREECSSQAYGLKDVYQS